MICLRRHPHEGSRGRSRAVHTVLSDTDGALPAGAVVTLNRLPATPNQPVVYRIKHADDRVLVHEVGDRQADVRLFERLAPEGRSQLPGR